MPDYQLGFLDLPNTRLHVLEAGDGPPLIIVPATISECRNWISLVTFMAQWFHAYFFELPGHGESSPYPTPFSSDMVAETVGHIADSIGAERFSLMGFSFGGILALKSYKHLSERVDNLILISPCLTHRAVNLSRVRSRLVLAVNWILSRKPVRRGFIRLLHNPRTVNLMFSFLQKLGRIEKTIDLRPKLLVIQESTIEVLNSQINDILTFHPDEPAVKHATPCYFAMSPDDPVLDFKTTLATIQTHFEAVNVLRLPMKYHQAPAPLTYESLNRDYYATVEEFLRKRK